MSGYEEVPMESGALPMLVSIFAVPLRPVPRYLRALRAFAGANPLKWLLVVLAVVGYAVAVLVYFAFALFPAVSYALLILMTLPLIIAVYAWKGIVAIAGRTAGAERAERAERVRGSAEIGRHGLA